MPDPPSQQRPKPGTILGGKYELTREIGSGGVGVVFEGLHIAFQKRVAIKILRSQFATDIAMRESFAAEGRATAAIAHANVVNIYDIGECPNGAPYLVMELLLGETISELLQKSGPFPIELAAEIILQALAGLAASHRHGIVHRDLKSANIIVTYPRPERPLVKLVDFGVAQSSVDFPEAGGAEARVWGTPLYTAPEQALGDPVDARTDLFSLGVILYEMLAGKPPHVGDNPTQIFAAMFKPQRTKLSELNPALPVALSDLVERALSVKPEQRFQTAAEFAEALGNFVPGARGLSLISQVSPSLFGRQKRDQRRSGISGAPLVIELDSAPPPGLLRRLASLSPRLTDSLLTFPKIPKAPAAPRIDPRESSKAPAQLEFDLPKLSDQSLLRSAQKNSDQAALAIERSRQWTTTIIAAGTGFGAGLLLAHWAGLI